MEDLYYYNSNNQILINNSNNYISNEFKMILNYTELEREIPQELDEKFIYFIIHFNTVFDIELLKSHILYEGKLYEIENETVRQDKTGVTVTNQTIINRRIKPLIDKLNK